ncbi:cytochrome P450 oxidoreductase [Colletotrichum scovillei]|uniref:Cytochrome P450 oxidoreductase n=1 Tax=Colletotrichum scovillei TaxID=1209932 RepID=A0A9P7R401_9PEZI|nr:cytochrome P450 oxidoreductase [Colletotrichum scovillei]KAF4785598.1 cytochrome P450 oxidoreductase [Colletotrichum scovillei]KAG7048118.1 cytochrome P450 oxidoreductase [Colletotrichum scovillei]KAG7065283.1 cytochrome P450 oxidoreductase [Colletotrichum scovillei]KAG7067886.1 cytochrome P450 oxidoreductase [Colletotrichum scovillei]
MLGLLALAGVAFAVVSYLVIRPIILYFYDPKGLRKYPNYSPLSPLTDLRHCYLSAQGFRSKELYETHKHTGFPILRTGPNALSFGDTRAIKDIYGHSTKCVKDNNYVVLSGTHRHLFDVVDKPEHARKRKLLSAAFAIKNLEKWEYKVAYTAERLFKAFDGKCTDPLKSTIPCPADLTIDFNHWINLWTIEAINYITLSTQMDLLDTGTDVVTAEKRDGTTYKARYRHSMNQGAIAQAAFVWDYDLWPWVEWLSKTIPSRWKKMWKDFEPWDDCYYHAAAERLRRYQSGEQLDDFFTCMMEDKTGSPNNLDWGEIVAEVGAIINAGSDTTAIALTHILEILIKHPNHMKKLREEIDSVLDSDEVIAPYDKVKDLPFLRACIDEALRIIPPTSAPLPRRTPPEGARILDEWIPGDTSVSMTIYGAHRDPKIFPDPEVFKPERWLDPEERKRMEPYFIPFSTGARGCIGRNISYLEQIMVLASLVHRYEFALPSPDFVLQRHEAFNIICGALPVKIWRRKLE